MTFSYDAAEPAAKDRVRGLCGDTSGRDQQDHERVTDEFIAGLLAGNGNDELSAAIECARRRLAAIAGQKDDSERAPGLGTTRRYDRLQGVLDGLLARAAGSQGTGIPAMTTTAPLVDATNLPRFGMLTDPSSVVTL